MAIPKVARRITAGICGFLAALVLVELVLQTAAFFTKPTRTLKPIAAGDGVVIAFAGDSHTFGLWCKEEEAMPAVISRLSKSWGTKPVVSVNCGRAGVPTWTALEEARTAILTHHPSMLVFRAGINNMWVDPGAGLLSNLRIYKLFSILKSHLWQSPEDNPIQIFPISVRRDEGGGKAPRQSFKRLREPADYETRVSPRIRKDALELAEFAKTRGCEVVLVSYLSPGEFFPSIGRDLEAAATTAGIGWISLSQIGRDIIAAGGRRDVFFPDGHPRAVGYEIEARAIWNWMIDTGRLGGSRCEDPLAWYLQSKKDGTLPRNPHPQLKLIKQPGGGLQVEIRAEPVRSGSILLGVPGESFEIDGWVFPLARRDFLICSSDPRFQFITDAAGRATVDLSSDVMTKAGPSAVICCTVHVGVEGSPERNVSEVLRVEDGGAAAQQAESK